MVKFGEYLIKCSVSRYADKYVRYNYLKSLLDDLKAKRIAADEAFYQNLEMSYIQTRNFAEDWIVRLERATSTSLHYDPEIIAESIELNQFVFVNQEAIRKIIKKHDKNLSQCRLMPVWYWKLGKTSSLFFSIASVKMKFNE